MKVKSHIAVATVSGKAYYMLVNELKGRDIPFLSIVPGEPIPSSVKVVLTTKNERDLINHPKILVYDVESDPSDIINEALRIVMSKNIYEELIMGVDPGKTFGIAMLADGRTLKREEGLSMEKTIDLILTELKRNPSKTQIVRIGRGMSDLAEEVARRLEIALPENVLIEMVNEEGTSTIRNKGFRKKVSDADSAIRIASKRGKTYLRGR